MSDPIQSQSRVKREWNLLFIHCTWSISVCCIYESCYHSYSTAHMKCVMPHMWNLHWSLRFFLVVLHVRVMSTTPAGQRLTTRNIHVLVCIGNERKCKRERVWYNHALKICVFTHASRVTKFSVWFFLPRYKELESGWQVVGLRSLHSQFLHSVNPQSSEILLKVHPRVTAASFCHVGLSTERHESQALQLIIL